MRLCMFHPVDRPLERGWVGRIDGDHVVQLAAQTLESYFTGGGTAREHAVYPLAAVRLLAPVLHPPAIRVFDDGTSFSFANPAAIVGPEATIDADERPLALLARVAAVVGAEERIGGFTLLAEWRRPEAAPPKDRDFALGLGPAVVTEELREPEAGSVRVGRSERTDVVEPFDWVGACRLARRGTALRPGDLLAAPAWTVVEPIAPASRVELELEPVGTLRQEVR